MFDPMLQPFGPFKLSFDEVYHDEGQDVWVFLVGSLKDGAKQHGQLVGQSVRRIFSKHRSESSCHGATQCKQA